MRENITDSIYARSFEAPDFSSAEIEDAFFGSGALIASCPNSQKKKAGVDKKIDVAIFDKEAALDSD
ncbi:MAG: hypothetical protein G01um101420_44 [Parcubacteria group bacterium Gr01-1014_20]|nr:MAG: hypothetical protein G01um101420_44 [Parcubacteria group bacterium Gr01-1014_20]